MRARLAAFLCAFALAAQAEPPRSGREFQSPDLQKLQDDDFAHPGMLWVARGERLWREAGAARSCAGCHGEPAALRGAATRYPRYDAQAAGLLNLEGRINACRTRFQRLPALAYESEHLLALTALVAHQSRGMAPAVAIDGPARAHFDNGARLYRERIGQFNLSCAQCHDGLAGRRLGPEVISEGHANGYPAYRLEWQGLGSLHRRIRACNSGVRAHMLPAGAPDYLDIELYLAWRARGLPIETPALRR
jgi:sulfur-oxidizing protein SoxA